MPSYAHVLVNELPCPYCTAVIRPAYGLLGFQWGYCPSRVPWDDLFYDIGDPIRWRLDDVGCIQPWKYFEGVLQGGNLGDPKITNLLVRAFDLGGGDVECPRCSTGLALRIEHGTLVGFVPALHGCDIAIFDVEGHAVPRPEWDDCPMEIVRVRSKLLATGDGSPIRSKSAP